MLIADDIRQFIFVRKSKNLCYYNGKALGKVVRWYLSKNGEPILTQYAHNKNMNKVAGSESCTPIMNLPNILPDDLDKERYIREAEEIKNAFTRVSEGSSSFFNK